MVARHGKGTIVGAHFGCAAEEMDYVADVMRKHPHYIVDVAARLQDIGRYDPSRVVEFFTEFQDRILLPLMLFSIMQAVNQSTSYSCGASIESTLRQRIKAWRTPHVF